MITSIPCWKKPPSCTLPSSELDSLTVFRSWLWCHLPIQVIITLGVTCVLAWSLLDRLWKHSWFEKKKILWRHVSVTETPHPPAYITHLMAPCFSAVNNLAHFFSSFVFPFWRLSHKSLVLYALTCPYNSHSWQQSNYIPGARITSYLTLYPSTSTCGSSLEDYKKRAGRRVLALQYEIQPVWHKIRAEAGGI